jgi:hypothetical protein
MFLDKALRTARLPGHDNVTSFQASMVRHYYLHPSHASFPSFPPLCQCTDCTLYTVHSVLYLEAVAVLLEALPAVPGRHLLPLLLRLAMHG